MKGQRHRVAIREHVCQCRFAAVQLDPTPGAGELRAKLFDRRFDEDTRVHRLEPVWMGGRLESSELQEVLDQPLQATALARKRLIVLLATGLERHAAGRQQLRQLTHRRERRPELVGHGRHEVGLQPGQRDLLPHRAADEVGACKKEGKHHGQPDDDEPPSRQASGVGAEAAIDGLNGERQTSLDARAYDLRL